MKVLIIFTSCIFAVAFGIPSPFHYSQEAENIYGHPEKGAFDLKTGMITKYCIILCTNFPILILEASHKTPL